MSRDNISVQYPMIDNSQSVLSSQITKFSVTPANGISIQKALVNKNNTLMICIENTSENDTEVTLKAGDNYPNSMLGDLNIKLLSSSMFVVQLQDIARFENKDGSINLDFNSDFKGNIFAIAKSTSLNI